MFMKRFYNLTRIVFIFNLFIVSCDLAFASKNSSIFIEEISNLKTELNPEEYILGAGDLLFIDILGVPELSGEFLIGPSGDLFLPELRNIKAEGLTLKQLNILLTEKYEKTVKDPNLFLKIIKFRPIRVYVHGEVVRPGFYTITKSSLLFDDNSSFKGNLTPDSRTDNSIGNQQSTQSTNSSFYFPTLYDSLKAAQGVTPYSNLSEIYIKRITPSSFDNKIIAKVSILSLFKDGDQSQNIRIFDNDIIEVKKSNEMIPEQLSLVRNSNLNPDFNVVFVGGMVKSPGKITLPKSSGLNQAIAMAGGKKLLSGRVQFLRYQQDGQIDQRQFNFDPKSKINSYKNPILVSGDIINVKDTTFGKGTKIFNQVTDPLIRIYSVYKIFD